MTLSPRFGLAALLTTAVLGSGTAMAGPASAALPEPDPDPTPRCGPGKIWDDNLGACVPVAVSVSPIGAHDMSRQNTARNAVRITGWALDKDTPTVPIQVQVHVDSAAAGTFTASAYRPDVATAHPGTGSYHGYDVTLPLSGGSHTICVTAVNVGSGTNRALGCRSMDAVTEFTATGITYQVGSGRIHSTQLEQLDRVTQTNNTAVQQSTEISGATTVTDSRTWSDSLGAVKLNVGFAVPLVKVVQNALQTGGTATYTRNNTTSTSTAFSWRQPVIVPARSKIVATVALGRSTVSVPYTLSGYWVYASGTTAGGSVPGTYSGVTSHDLAVELAQFNLDGTPASRPVQQPPAQLS